jgi:hypothetical protein
VSRRRTNRHWSDGFRFVAEHEGYLRFLGFETDDAFEEVARLIVGTLAHARRTPMDDHIRVELQLSMPPPVDAVPPHAQ